MAKTQKEINNIEEGNKGRIVIIADRRIEIYNQTILNKWAKFDQIELWATDTYLERTLSIIHSWEPLGIVPEKGYPIRFEKKEEDIVMRDGKKIRKPVNRITLTKQPDQFRFTKI